MTRKAGGNSGAYTVVVAYVTFSRVGVRTRAVVHRRLEATSGVGWEGPIVPYGALEGLSLPECTAEALRALADDLAPRIE